MSLEIIEDAGHRAADKFGVRPLTPEGLERINGIGDGGVRSSKNWCSASLSTPKPQVPSHSKFDPPDALSAYWPVGKIKKDIQLGLCFGATNVICLEGYLKRSLDMFKDLSDLEETPGSLVKTGVLSHTSTGPAGARKQKWEDPRTSQDTHVPAFHVWSNFEIADLDFWRGEAYTKSFDYFDAKGGFYYERWADNTVRSIVVALFARKRPDGIYLLLPPPICDASIIIAALLRQYRLPTRTLLILSTGCYAQRGQVRVRYGR
ncbi:glycolipid 2-alpha-mannosyltransferase-domain-containing protein [Mycena vulgaris]|nr:glycolipid 2-alpha-mannosyltransferase-domain-containing protein [Mycena vulgaris]